MRRTADSDRDLELAGEPNKGVGVLGKVTDHEEGNELGAPRGDQRNQVGAIGIEPTSPTVSKGGGGVSEPDEALRIK